ncbi:MAG: TM2 domain-containing protein [Clostridia bacterium]
MKTVQVSKIAGLLITIFTGYLGIHKFLTGNILMGVLYLCTGGFCYIGVIIDIIKIVQGTYVDKQGQPWAVD